MGCVEGSVLVAMADAVGTTEPVARGEAETERVTETVAEVEAMLAEGARETVSVGELVEESDLVWVTVRVGETKAAAEGLGEKVTVGDTASERDPTCEAVIEMVPELEGETAPDADTAGEPDCVGETIGEEVVEEEMLKLLDPDSVRVKSAGVGDTTTVGVSLKEAAVKLAD